MKTGDIVLIPFPFAEMTGRKVRPAAVVCETADKYRDVVLCAISSIVAVKPTPNEIVLTTDSQNNLRRDSTLKVDRIVTAKSSDVIAQIGRLSEVDLKQFQTIFKCLVKI